jgi:AcrR family transcriptional regulator
MGGAVTDTANVVAGRPRRRSGRRKTDSLDAAALVIAERGADAARFVDVAAQSGVPVSSLQYYFGSREDLVVAAFRHASETELITLTSELATREDPWERIVYIIDDALRGYRPGDDVAGRLWIEAWHFGLRDEEMRADVNRDYSTWQELIEEAIDSGVELGRFVTSRSAQSIAVVILALLDGVGLRIVARDPRLSYDDAAATIIDAVRALLDVRTT